MQHGVFMFFISYISGITVTIKQDVTGSRYHHVCTGTGTWSEVTGIFISLFVEPCLILENNGKWVSGSYMSKYENYIHLQ